MTSHPEAPIPAPSRTVCLHVLENHAADHFDGGQVVFQLAHPQVDLITGQPKAAKDRVHSPVDRDEHEDADTPDEREAAYPSPTFVFYTVVQRNRHADRGEGGVVHFSLVRGGKPPLLMSGDVVLSARQNALLRQYPWRTRAAKASRFFKMTLFESTTGYVDTVHTAPNHPEECVDGRAVLSFADDAAMRRWPWKTAEARESRYFLLTIEEIALDQLPPDPDAVKLPEPAAPPVDVPEPVRVIAPPAIATEEDHAADVAAYKQQQEVDESVDYIHIIR